MAAVKEIAANFPSGLKKFFFHFLGWNEWDALCGTFNQTGPFSKWLCTSDPAAERPFLWWKSSRLKNWRGNLSNARLLSLFFPFALCLQQVSIPAEHKGKNKMSVEHTAQHALVYYSLNMLGCRDNSGAQTPSELWQSGGDKRTNQGASSAVMPPV